MPQNLFGKELERLRNLLNDTTDEKWTQKKVSEKIGVTAQAYQNWMHGRRGKDIDLATLKKLADVLHGDFKTMVGLARPDVLKYCEELTEQHAHKSRNPLPDEVASLSEILLRLYKKDKSEFNRIKKMIEDLYRPR